MLGRENTMLVAIGELVAGVEQHAEIGGVCDGLDCREYAVGRGIAVLVPAGADVPAAIPREPEVLAYRRDMVELSGRDIIAHAVDLIVVAPQIAGGAEIHAHRIA